ncbi:MAG: tetratricopeptide repeat protein [Segetibacter sp.]|nr:tetratricopeptide repeat protein [Segetibacter sp.]
MRKFILFIVVSFLFLDVPAQSSRLKQLQEELKSHPQQDTILVNRLNKMAGRRELSTPGRDSASADALIISPQLRYIAGEVRALLRQAQTKDKALKFDLMKQAVAVGEKAGQAVVRRNLQILMLWQMNIYDSAIMV